MTGIVNTGSLAKALMPGVNKWIGGTYMEFPTEWNEIVDVSTSEKNFEQDVGMAGTGLAVIKPEASPIEYDDMSQGTYVTYTHVVYALGMIISREAIEDNLYEQLIQQRSIQLAFSMRQTKENVCANLLNRAFNSSYVGRDGLSLCNSAHLLNKGGTFSNQMAVAMDLSELALEQAMIDIGGYVNDANLRIAVKANKLIIPRQLQFEAQRILKSQLQYNTANNSLNALKDLGMLPGGIHLNHYLTSSTAWFIKTDCPDGLKLFQRRPLEVGNDTPDFNSEVMKFKTSERYSVGWTDERGVYGTAGV